MPPTEPNCNYKPFPSRKAALRYAIDNAIKYKLDVLETFEKACYDPNYIAGVKERIQVLKMLQREYSVAPNLTPPKEK